MKIALITQYYFPYEKSTAKLMKDLACELAKQQHDVLVITPNEDLQAPYQLSIESGVRVLRIRSRSFNVKSTLQRAITEIVMVFASWKYGKKIFKEKRYDLIVWWTPSLFYIYLVSRLKNLWKVSSYLLIRDFVPQWWVDCGLIRKNSILYKFFRLLELRQYKIADTVAIQSPGNLRYFIDEKLDWVKTEVLWNWSTSSGEEIHKTETRKELGLEGKIVFFYGGNIGKAQDVDNIIRLAMKFLKDNSVHFLFVGDGSEVLRLKTFVKTTNIGNVTFLPSVDQKTYLGMLSEYDVGIISLDRKHSTQNFPGKMLNYMYFSIPCLASINPGNDLKELLESRQAGLVSINGDDELLYSNALQFASNSVLRKELGANGRKALLEVFSVEVAAKQIASHIKI